MKKNRFCNECDIHILLKTLRIMKITVFLLLASILQTFANDTYSQKTKLSLDFTGTKLVDVLDEIESKTEFFFLFNEKLIDTGRKVNMSVENEKIDEILNELFSGSDVVYTITDRKIILAPSFLSENEQQQNSISGKVTDESGEPLPGVTVIIKGTTQGTITNGTGEYSLTNIPENATLVFSFVGMRTQEVIVAGKTTINVSMEVGTIGIEEVVSIGYATVKKSDLTGSVGSVSDAQIKNLPASSFQQALQGQISGVQVIQNTGSPGSGMVVRIRGNSSISAGNDPLYVIDGFPVSGSGRGTDGFEGGSNPMNSINPADIESIDILKDASATAIYGSRGANGVILITTKSGKAGKGNITFNVYRSVQNASKKVDVLNAEEFAQLHIDSRNNGWLRSGGDPNTPNENRGKFRIPSIYFDPTQWQVTDWQDEVLRTGIIQSYNLGATGGSEFAKYSLSASYFQNEGILLETSLKRYTLRANIEAKLSDKLKAGIKITPSYSINDGAKSEGAFSSSALGMALRMPPIIGPYTSDGSYTNTLALRNNVDGIGTLGKLDNPVANLKEDIYILDAGRILNNMYLEYEILKNLKFKTSVGFDLITNRVHQFLSSKTGRAGTPPPSVPSGMASSSQELEWLNENILTYDKEINDKNKFSVMGGFSLQKNDYRYIRIDGKNYPNDNVQYVSAAGTVESGTETRNQSSLASLFTRLNYIISEKYLITGTIRRDGSSRFGPENKYGLFPSAALAWRMSEEDFMKYISFISNFKWRLSYGVSGNNDIANYAYVPNIVNNNYVLGTTQTLVNAIYTGRLSNPYMTWETMRSVNLGMDVSLFDNRINLTVDAYKSNTDGLLLNVNIPAVSGFGTTLENIGEVENKGLEISINSWNLVGDFKWNTAFNISFNRNKVISLGGSAGDFIDDGISRTIVGKPMGLFYTRVTDGIFNTQEEIDNYFPQDNNPAPGDRRFKDVNNDEIVNNNDLDFTGDPNPDFIFGFTNNFSWKNFELGLVINGSYGNDIYYMDPAALNLNGNVNNIGIARERWRSAENPGRGDIPKTVYGFTTYSDVGSDFFVVDGSYIRLSNVTLGYNVPRTILDKVRVQNARIYLAGQNLLTISNDYPGYDPETGSGGSNPLSHGIDDAIYPIARVFTLGLNLTF